MRTKILLVIITILATTLASLSSDSLLAWEARDLIGNYELQGVMEMAGGLSLKPDQKYSAGFSYGAADWMEEGSWKPDGDGMTISGSHFKQKNTNKIPLFLPSGTHFVYKDGRLTATGPGGSVTFVDPNKTTSHRKDKGEAGEGRMIVRGKVLKLDADELVVKTKECMMFSVSQLSPDILKAAKVGKTIDVEIPYSAIIGGGSCPE